MPTKGGTGMKEIGYEFRRGGCLWTVMGYTYYSGNDLFYVCIRDYDGKQDDIWSGDIK